MTAWAHCAFLKLFPRNCYFKVICWLCGYFELRHCTSHQYSELHTSSYRPALSQPGIGLRIPRDKARKSWDLKVCDVATLIQLLCVWTLSVVLILFTTPSSFAGWILSPTLLGPNR
jgi:hypothetical protein